MGAGRVLFRAAEGPYMSKIRSKQEADRLEAGAAAGGIMRLESSHTGEPSPSRTGQVRFGSVTLTHVELGDADAKRNVDSGRIALSSIKEAFSKPGVRIRAAKGVALYHADPTQPGQLIRVLDGKRDAGVLVGGQFRAV